MGDCRDSIIKAKYGIRAVIIAREIGAQHRTKYTEYKYEVERGLSYSALREGSKRNGDKLN